MQLRFPYARVEQRDDGLFRVEADLRDDIARTLRIGRMKGDPVLRPLLTVREVAHQPGQLGVIEAKTLPRRDRLGQHGAMIGLVMAEDEAADAIGGVPRNEPDTRLMRRG